METNHRERLGILVAELAAIRLWNQLYLDARTPPDEIDQVAYRARQERMMEIADEIIKFEIQIGETVAAADKQASGTARRPSNSVLARWPGFSNSTN
jgi:hypothetical protein